MLSLNVHGSSKPSLQCRIGSRKVPSQREDCCRSFVSLSGVVVSNFYEKFVAFWAPSNLVHEFDSTLSRPCGYSMLRIAAKLGKHDATEVHAICVEAKLLVFAFQQRPYAVGECSEPGGNHAACAVG